MKVTKIQKQARRSDRYSIYIDDKYSFSLNDYQLVSSGISVGKIFTEDELAKLISDSKFGKAYERTLNYIMIRPRSRREILDYLSRTYLYPRPKIYLNSDGERVVKKQSVDKDEVGLMIDRVIDRLEGKGYIDDQRFASSWVQSRQLTKNYSIRRLRQELQTKGVDSSIIDKVLSTLDGMEVDNLKLIIEKKRKLTRFKNDEKLIQYLLRQGFRHGDIKAHLEEY